MRERLPMMVLTPAEEKLILRLRQLSQRPVDLVLVDLSESQVRVVGKKEDLTPGNSSANIAQAFHNTPD